MTSIAMAVRGVLEAADPPSKIRRARQVARDWRLGRIEPVFDVPMPDRPARPDEPVLLAPGAMPRRGRG